MRNLPRPGIVVLTDRDDGTLWRLVHDLDTIRVGISSYTIARWQQAAFRVYPAGEEPVLSLNPTIRLIVRGGYLGYEVDALTAPVTDKDNALIMTRVADMMDRTHYIINRGDESRYWQYPGDTLGYTEFE